MLRTLILVLTAIALLGGGLAHAEVVIEWVTVGDAGNAADTHVWSQGAVEYDYEIGKYEVTNGQYIEFLNAVARVEDTYSLYNDTHFGGGMPGTYGGIERTGSPGNYSYGPKGGDTSWLNKPVNFVSYYDALRFANWVHNRQPSGAQDPTSTEDGAYTFSGPTTVGPRNLDARVFLASGDEWYKAAYYKGGSTDAGYWDYATQSDDAPIAEPPPGHPAPPGSANYANVVGPPYYCTDIGAYVLSPSPYGTFDQNGNVSEWAEGSYLPGGSCDAGVPPASVLNWGWPDLEAYGVGFRVAGPWLCESDEDCDDGEFCNGLETCDPMTGCQPGALVDCSELTDQCNEGVCDEPSDSCVAVSAEDGTACDDGDLCPGDTCQAGTCAPVNCVLYVDDDAPLGGDGTNWSTPFRYLQDALGAATTDDEIHVAGGTYKPDQDEAGDVTPGNRYETFQLINAVGIYGGYAGLANPGNPDQRDVTVYETVLSGDIGVPGHNLDNTCHVVTGSETNDTAILDGVTVTAGTANGSYPRMGGGMYNDWGSPTLIECTFAANAADGDDGYGGGMYNWNYSNPTLINCTFDGNWAADYGGAVANHFHSSPAFMGCTFQGNSAGWGGGGVLNSQHSSPTLTNCSFSDNLAEDDGGGLYNSFLSSPTLIDCVFSANSAGSNGGAMWNDYDCGPRLESCIFLGNSAGSSGGAIGNTSSSLTLTGCTFDLNSASGKGGGMYNHSGDPTLTSCSFSGNVADGENAMGGGMSNYAGSPTLVACSFEENSATLHGGGLSNYAGSPTLSYCIFRSNSAGDSGGGIDNANGSPALHNCVISGNSASDGGGMRNVDHTNGTLANCIFSGNSASEDGGGMYNVYFSSPTLDNCIFSGNRAVDEGGGMFNMLTSDSTLTNSILWNNTAFDGPQIHGIASTPTVTYSCVQDDDPNDGSMYPGAGNIDDDPFFVDSGYWDDGDTPSDPSDDVWGDGSYRVQPGSPCINAGDPDYLAEPGETDLDGHARVLCGRVDMGAYEFGIGDFDCDQVVDLTDFASWAACMTGPHGGPYADTCEAFDFEFDNDVDLTDVAAFQRAFTAR